MKLLSLLKSKREKGATLVEYVILVALIALAVIAVVVLLGAQIQGVFSQIVASLSTVSGV
jgi:pilus assembly protein Flp/PilA